MRGFSGTDGSYFAARQKPTFPSLSMSTSVKLCFTAFSNHLLLVRLKPSLGTGSQPQSSGILDVFGERCDQGGVGASQVVPRIHAWSLKIAGTEERSDCVMSI